MVMVEVIVGAGDGTVQTRMRIGRVEHRSTAKLIQGRDLLWLKISSPFGAFRERIVDRCSSTEANKF